MNLVTSEVPENLACDAILCVHAAAGRISRHYATSQEPRRRWPHAAFAVQRTRSFTRRAQQSFQIAAVVLVEQGAGPL